MPDHSMTLLEIMERVGSREPELVKAYMKDALIEIAEKTDYTIKNALYNVDNSIKYYDLPSDCVELRSVYQKYTSDGTKYIKIPYVLDASLELLGATDSTGTASGSGDAIIAMTDIVLLDPNNTASTSVNSATIDGANAHSRFYGYFTEGDKLVILTKRYDTYTNPYQKLPQNVWILPTEDETLGVLINYKYMPVIPSDENDTLDLSRSLCLAVVHYIKMRFAEDSGDMGFVVFHRGKFYEKTGRAWEARKPYRRNVRVNHSGALK